MVAETFVAFAVENMQKATPHSSALEILSRKLLKHPNFQDCQHFGYVLKHFELYVETDTIFVVIEYTRIEILLRMTCQAAPHLLYGYRS